MYHCFHSVKFVEESLFFTVIREMLITGVASSGLYQGVIKTMFCFGFFFIMDKFQSL